MNSSIIRVGTIAVLLVGTLGGQTAVAQAKTVAPSSSVKSQLRISAPHIAQVRTSVAGRRSLERGTLLGPHSVSGMVPTVPQTPSRSRTLPEPVPSLSNPFNVSVQELLINQDRATNGNLAPLAWSSCLANIAMQNAQRIAAQGYLSHTNGPELDLGCDPSYTTAGENIADWSGGINDAQVNTMFMNSAPHRANILNGGYRYVGTAWVVASNGYGYIAVEFAG